MKKKVIICLLAIIGVFVFLSGNIAKADTKDDIPKMALSEAINVGVKEAIITDFDIPEYYRVNKALGRLRVWVHPGAGGGCWKYAYTADPYSFYKHTATGEWKMVQTTSNLNHTVNTVIGGWAKAPSALIYYNPAYEKVLGGC